MLLRILAATLVIFSTLSITDCDSSLADSRVQTARAECELRIELPAQIKQNKASQLKVRINNVGKTPVTLVMPGDGSDVRWRTPCVGWSFLPVDSPDQHPQSPKRRIGRRCGNINPLNPTEIFVLESGNGQNLKQWIRFPHIIPPGKYRAVFYYSNVPQLKWHGVPLGKHDSSAMQQVKRSTPISLVSNEVIVEIIE